MLVSVKLSADFSSACALPMMAHTIRLTHSPHNSRIGTRKDQSQQEEQTEQRMSYLPRLLDWVMRC
jgi:hypothetical protein